MARITLAPAPSQQRHPGRAEALLVMRPRPPTGDVMIHCTRRAFAAAQVHRSTAVLEVGADLWLHRIHHDDLAPEQYRPMSSTVDVAATAGLVVH